MTITSNREGLGLVTCRHLVFAPTGDTVTITVSGASSVGDADAGD
jgi:hypothetical protein